ncbi:kinase-like protein [Auricularia subglabra TFB-10046 SS5]|nr:kinase-like protein [Auricularia subglabra TFB-10046 SS5]
MTGSDPIAPDEQVEPAPVEPQTGEADTTIQTSFLCNGEKADVRIQFRPIGRGSYGVVFPADMRTNGQVRKVVVKVHPHVLTTQARTDVQKAVAPWIDLEHPHVVPVLGVCDVGVMQVGLVTPYMENGNLLQFVIGKSLLARLRPIQQAAEGLRYLHVNAEMVHGDIKAENVLISSNESALLDGAGWSILVEKSQDTSLVDANTYRTVVFSAPELLMARRATDTNKHPSKTRATDVYAFGMLIFHAISGHLPWSGSHYSLVGARVTRGETPARTPVAPEGVPFSDALWDLCLGCWMRDPQQRPDSDALVNTLSEMILSEKAENAQAGRLMSIPIQYEGSVVQLEIDQESIIGGTLTGTVFKATLRTQGGPIAVAAKVLSMQFNVMSNFTAGKIWKRVQHPNILPFYGSCTTELGQMVLVSPLMKHGNMRTFLGATSDPGIRLELLRQIADAVVYLHMDVRCVHGNLTSANVIISDDERALISGFTYSTLIDSTEPTPEIIERTLYAESAAPELLMGLSGWSREPGVTEEMKPVSRTFFTDIYAFGMLAHEAYAGETLWKNLRVWEIRDKIIQGVRPTRPVEGQVLMSDGLWELCERCWDAEPSRRPDAETVLNTLKAL